MGNGERHSVSGERVWQIDHVLQVQASFRLEGGLSKNDYVPKSLLSPS